MIDALMTVMGSSAFGAVTGGLFGWLNRREDRKDRVAERQFQLEMVGRQADAATQAADARAFEESQKTKSAWGDAIKSMVRPLITGILLSQTYVILTSLETITGGIEGLPVDDAVQLYRDVVLNIISLTATAVAWWFASRGSQVNR